jgi:hypothetical protein
MANDARRSAAFMPLERETESRFEKTRTPGKESTLKRPEGRAPYAIAPTAG